MDRFEERIRDGYLYGDYQFATDPTRDSFLRRGVFSCYQPVPPRRRSPRIRRAFNPEDWARLTFYSHKYKRRAFEVYSSRYLKTSGQVYWADWQLSAAYVDNYHADLDQALRAKAQGTEMITEIYVQRTASPRSWRTRARRCGARREHDLRHRPADRARRRDVSGVGAGALRLRHLQPARRTHANARSSRRRMRSATSSISASPTAAATT